MSLPEHKPFFSFAATLQFIQFVEVCFGGFVGMSLPIPIQTHKTTYKLTNQTKLKSILKDLILQKVLRNSFTVPYLLSTSKKYACVSAPGRGRPAGCDLAPGACWRRDVKAGGGRWRGLVVRSLAGVI